MVIETANDHGVDLHRVEPELLRQRDTFQHSLESVAAGDLFEVFSIQRVQAETETAKSRLAQLARFLGEKETIARHCQIGDPGYGRNSLHQFLDPLPQKRLAASQTDLLDSSAHRKANDPLDFLEAEQVVFGHPLLNNGSRIW